MIQKSGQKIDILKFQKYSKTPLIIDECHHIPAQSYAGATVFPGRSHITQYGLNSDPFQKNSDGKLIFTHIGGMIPTSNPRDIEETSKKARVIHSGIQIWMFLNSKTRHLEPCQKFLY